MITRNIKTNLIGRNEPLRLLALAEALQVPILFVGPPGTGKTKLVLDYANSLVVNTVGEQGEHVSDTGSQTGDGHRDVDLKVQELVDQVHQGKVFILETDEGTRTSAIKGHVDFKKLATENDYQMMTPVADAEVVLINEIDKASPGLRNALLGIMNERVLFNGAEVRKCNWKMFIATCNEIPEDEKEENNPMWDRFLIKFNVSRLSPSQITDLYEKGAHNFRQIIDVTIPSAEEIDNVVMPIPKLEKFISIAYDHVSDRTLAAVPRLTKAVSLIWNCSVDKALIRTMELLCGPDQSKALSKQLLTPEMKEIINALQMLQMIEDKARLDKEMAAIEQKITAYYNNGKVDKGQLEELLEISSQIMDEHPVGDIESENQGENQSAF